MPGTDMGPNASYREPELVRQHLLNPLVEELRNRLGREIELIIEKDRTQPGVIYASMFAEAHDADVYIADLTGANPNVYLELGVRWALRDGVTVPISQSADDLEFNVAANRTIIYSPAIISKAVKNIVSAIEQGLKNNKVDSPVRLNSKVVAIRRSKLKNLEAELEQLKKARSADALTAAKATKRPTDRVEMLKQVVDANPASVEARIELGKTYRDLSNYTDAAEILEAAQRMAPTNAAVYRELGLCYSKLSNSDRAVEYLREAVHLAPGNAELLSNLGGALRRKGTAKAPGTYDQSVLQEARDSYQRAYELNKRDDKPDLYSALNVARLNLLLSRWNSELLERAKEDFHNQRHLCRHMVQERPNDYWRQFDLAEILLFSGQYEESGEYFVSATELIPQEERRDKILSVLGPLQDYLNANILEGTLCHETRKAVKILVAAREGT